jgi:hypothetical protein
MLQLAWFRFGRTLRQRLGDYVTVLLLIGVVGGLGMGAVAGARRTQAAFPVFLRASHASDLQIQFFRLGSAQPGSTFSGPPISANLYSPALTRDLGHLPNVSRVAVLTNMFISPVGAHGVPRLPEPLQTNEISEVGSVNGQFFTQDKVIADQGRLPDPSRLDEVAVTSRAATLLHWHLGQSIPMDAFSFEQVATSGNGPPKSPPVLRFTAKIVGIVALNDAVVNDAVDQYPTYLIFTPALTERMIALKGAGFSIYTLRLKHGSRDVGAVERELINALPPGSFYTFHVTSVVEGEAQRAIKPESIALGVFGAICFVAALLLAGQAVSRTLRRNAQDLYVLRALGASLAMTTVDALIGIFGAILAGAILAGTLCVGLSPIAPVGAVRQIDPAPGINVDWTVLGAGLGILVVALCAVALVLALVLNRRRTHSSDTARNASRIVDWASGAGLPVPAVAGIRFAIERRRGMDAVPVGSALVGAILAVAVVTTTLTFASGLNTLVSSPQLYGWNWNYEIQAVGGSSNVPPVATRLLDHDSLVAAWTGFGNADAQIDGQTVPILITRPGARIAPPIISGHGIENRHQVVLGGATLAQLHKHVGDTVTVSYGTPKDAPIYVPPTKLRVVGAATFPAIGAGGTLHTSMGTGALIPKGLEPPAFRRAQNDPDPNNNGPSFVVVRLRMGVSAAAGLSSLQRIVNATTRVYNADPNTGGGSFVVLPVQQPAEIVNYKAMGATPAILASALAASAVIALGLTLVASVRRRRRDLAVMRTLGFLASQLGAVVSWQASVTAVVGVAVGLPLGILLGQALWSSFAHAISAVSMPTVPALQLALAALGTLLLANAIALIPARQAAATPTALLLRTE